MSVPTHLSKKTRSTAMNAVISTAVAVVYMYSPALSAADAESVMDEDSVAETGKWSEKSIAKGKNTAIEGESLETLPENMRHIWGGAAEKKNVSQRSDRGAGEHIVDGVIPAYGVSYVSKQRNYSRGESLFHRVHHFLTDVNIRVMAGELGRRGPVLVASTDDKGRALKNGDVQLMEREPLPEEVQIREFYGELVALEKGVAFPNSAERNHFNEIAGDLNKAQGLLNFDLTEEGIKTIDEQYTAWRILIEVAKQRALEIATKEIMEKEDVNYKRARRDAERMELKFILPPLPMGEFAIRDARAELNRMNGVAAAQKTKNAKTKRMEEQRAEKEKPAVETAVEVVVEEIAEVVVEETVEDVADETAVTDPAVEVEIEVEEEVVETVDVEEEPEEINVEDDMDEIVEAPVVEETVKEDVSEDAAEEGDAEEDFDFDDDF